MSEGISVKLAGRLRSLQKPRVCFYISGQHCIHRYYLLLSYIRVDVHLGQDTTRNIPLLVYFSFYMYTWLLFATNTAAYTQINALEPIRSFTYVGLWNAVRKDKYCSNSLKSIWTHLYALFGMKIGEKQATSTAPYEGKLNLWATFYMIWNRFSVKYSFLQCVVGLCFYSLLCICYCSMCVCMFISTSYKIIIKTFWQYTARGCRTTSDSEQEKYVCIFIDQCHNQKQEHGWNCSIASESSEVALC